MALKTKNVFIDTSIFESENFIAGAKLTQLIELGRNNELNLIITQITYNEIIERAKVRITEAITILKKLNKEGRVLKNILDFKDMFKKFNTGDELNKLKIDLDSFLKKGKVKIIDYADINIKTIFDSYFENRPPFKEGNKKHEFPDAFSLELVRKWLNNKSNSCYCLTKDKDMVFQENDCLIRVDDFSSFIDKRIREIEIRSNHEDRLSKIDKVYKRHNEKLKHDLETRIKELIFEDLTNSNFYHEELEVEDVEIHSISIVKDSIIQVGEYDAKIELEIEVDFEAKIIVEEPESWFYSQEYVTSDFQEESPKLISDNITLPASIIVNHSPPAGDEFSDIIIDSINYDRDLNFYV